MTLDNARNLLRAVRLGYGSNVPVADITRALQLTGDLPSLEVPVVLPDDAMQPADVMDIA